MNKKILLVEDDDTFAFVAAYSLQSEGYAVIKMRTDEFAEHADVCRAFDMVVIDFFPDPHSALNLCQWVRDETDKKATSILMNATARNASSGCFELDRGISSYIVKPFPMSEFLQRVAILFRPALHTLEINDLLLERDRQRAERNGRELRLASVEFRLLEFFMQEPGRIFSRRELRNAVWGPNANINDRSIDVYIGRLRKALIRGRETDPILTVKGGGYGLNSCAADIENQFI